MPGPWIALYSPKVQTVGLAEASASQVKPEGQAVHEVEAACE